MIITSSPTAAALIQLVKVSSGSWLFLPPLQMEPGDDRRPSLSLSLSLSSVRSAAHFELLSRADQPLVVYLGQQLNI